MKKALQIFLILTLALISCKKPNERQCLKFKGDLINKRVEISPFETLKIYDYIEVELVQDTINFLELIGGQNEISFISVNRVDKELILLNENKCRWLRSGKEKPKVIVHFVNISKIEQWGSEPLKTVNSITVPSLQLVFMEVTCDAKIELDVVDLVVSLEPGFTLLQLKGEADNFKVVCKKSCQVNSELLKVNNNLVFLNYGNSDSYISAPANNMKVQINYSSNIFYKGTPTNIDLDEFSTGRLIDNN
jgi:hypothetical protein